MFLVEQAKRPVQNTASTKGVIFAKKEGIDVPLPVAQEIVKEIHTVAKLPPTVSYNVQAPTPQQAAKVVEQQIKAKYCTSTIAPGRQNVCYATGAKS